jgi:elongation factor P
MLATDLKTGKIYKEDDTPYLVLKYTHTKVARGGATVKVKARNLLTGSVYEKGYKAADRVENADVIRKNAQYLYFENGYVFMDPETFEQFSVSKETVGESAKFLVEGEKVQVQYFDGKPISVELPNTMDFNVTYTEPGFKGNTVSNVYKEATLDNGANVKVPSFVKIGDRVKINTRTEEYVSKA